MRDIEGLALLKAIGTRRPAVHCLTNTVVQALTANMLLAVGAIPSMSSDLAEVADFTNGANALLINLGTLDGERKSAIEAAIAAAQAVAIPWILDPVLIDRSPPRRAYARELLALKPALIRGNSGEIAALDRDTARLAETQGAIVAVTGAIDHITDGHAERTVDAGHELMSRVTGIGCAGTAMLAAALSVSASADRLDAVATGLALFGEAGEEAARKSGGPGTFATLLLDSLYQFSQYSLQERKDNE